MSVLLLAACGKAVGRAAPPPLPVTTASPVATVDPTSSRAAVTVPDLGPATARARRTLIPLSPATHPAPSTATRTGPATSTRPVHTTVSSTSVPTTTSNPTTSHSKSTRTTPSTSPTPVDPTTGSTTTTTTATSSSRRVSSAGLSGKVVAIDPGHNGANGAHPEIINRLIDGGYGQRNVCNTTGTETNAGYTEHEFTWHVASYLKPLLQARGITVVMTRASDTGVGPCTDKRASMENNADADAVVSIHGDGAPADVRGFYVLTASRPPAGPTIAAESLRLAACIAGAAVAAGFPPSNTLGSGGLWKRDDLTGLNRSTRPKILIECGNMRNAAEAALMSSAAGQRRYAQALAQGVFAYLQG